MRAARTRGGGGAITSHRRVWAVVLVASPIAVGAALDPGGPLAGAASAAVRVAAWAAVLGGAAAVAGRALRSDLAGIARWAWDGGVGLAVLTAAIVAAGQVPGAFRRGTIAAGVVALGVAALAFRPRRAPAPSRSDASSRAGVAALVAVLLVGFAWDRVPPVFFDTLAYHFAQPELWLANGRIAPETWSLHSWFPPGMSGLYGVGLAIGGESAANDANLLVGLLLLALARDTASRLWGNAAGLVACLTLATLPITLHALGVPAADLGHGAFGFGALAGWLLWRRTADPVWSRRAAAFAVGAATTKYLGLLVPLLLGAALFAVFPPAGASRRARAALARALAFVAPAVLLLLPWLGANAAATGNPVAPVLAGTIPTAGLAPGGAAAFRADARGGLPGLEEVAAIVPRLVTGDPASEGIYPTPAWGWFPLIALALAPLAVRGDPALRATLALAGATLAIWVSTFRWERFLVACSALIALAVGAVVVRAWRRGSTPRLAIALAAVTAVLGAVRAGLAVLAFTGGAPVALGVERPAAFRHRAFPFEALYDRLDARLDPASTRLLLLGEMRHFGLDLPHAAPGPFNLNPLAASLVATADPHAVTADLRRLGFTHVVVDLSAAWRSAERWPSLAPLRGRRNLLAGYLATLGPPIDFQGGVACYALPGASQERE